MEKREKQEEGGIGWNKKIITEIVTTTTLPVNHLMVTDCNASACVKKERNGIYLIKFLITHFN